MTQNISGLGETMALLESHGKFKRGEAGVSQLVTVLLDQGVFGEAAGLPEVLHYEREFPLPRGRADFVLFHADGTATVLEAKRGGDTRLVLTAIGQAMSYAAQLGYGRSLKGVRVMVTADMTGNESLHIDEACRLAGAIWLPLGRLEEHGAVWKRIIEKAGVRSG